MCAQQRKGRTFITKGDAALCTRYGGSNIDAFFSLSLVPSLFLREKSEEVKKAPLTEKKRQKQLSSNGTID
jgi:hypothetical protein